MSDEIPSLPEHPRFRMHEGKAQWMFGWIKYEGTRQCVYEDIETLMLFDLENCCCVAIVQWENIWKTVFDSRDDVKAMLIYANVDAWRAYMQSRLGVEKKGRMG